MEDLIGFLLIAILIMIAWIFVTVVRKDIQEEEKKTQPKSKEKIWFSTGWYWNDEKQLWEPPDYLKAESREKWSWDENKRIWVDNTKKQAAPRTTPKSEYEGVYEATPLLTRNESQNFEVLLRAAERKGYIVNAKVRLADLIRPRNDANFMALFGKIKSKHVDFVVCDRTMHPIVIIELDDSSHDRKDRQERDAFVDTILKDAGYRIIHTRQIRSDILDGM